MAVQNKKIKNEIEAWVFKQMFISTYIYHRKFLTVTKISLILRGHKLT